jgi:hypothetical protein
MKYVSLILLQILLAPGLREVRIDHFQFYQSG